MAQREGWDPPSPPILQHLQCCQQRQSRPAGAKMRREKSVSAVKHMGNKMKAKRVPSRARGAAGPALRGCSQAGPCHPSLLVTDTARSLSLPSGEKAALASFPGKWGSYKSCGNHTTIRGKRKVMLMSRDWLQASPWVGAGSDSKGAAGNAEQPGHRNSLDGSSSQGQKG